MLLRTHLAIIILLILIFAPEESFILFFGIALIAAILPDIDTKFSSIGKHFKLLNFFMKHRGIIHSFTFLLALSFILFLFLRQALFPFVLGYSAHLIADSTTVSGIRPFYPLKLKIKGIIKTGRLAENLIFALVIIFDFILLFKRF